MIFLHNSSKRSPDYFVSGLFCYVGGRIKIVMTTVYVFMMICLTIYITNEDYTRKTRHIETMLVKCWPTICDAGPALNQHFFNVSCLLGNDY